MVVEGPPANDRVGGDDFGINKFAWDGLVARRRKLIISAPYSLSTRRARSPYIDRVWRRLSPPKPVKLDWLDYPARSSGKLEHLGADGAMTILLNRAIDLNRSDPFRLSSRLLEGNHFAAFESPGFIEYNNWIVIIISNSIILETFRQLIISLSLGCPSSQTFPAKLDWMTPIFGQINCPSRQMCLPV